MSLHQNLPIYKQCYDLLSLATDVQLQMPRSFKASLGVDIHKECVNLLVLIARANAARGGNRAQYVLEIVERLDVVAILLRVCRDKKFISNKLWANSVDLTGGIGKQAGGWLKSSRQASAS